MLCWVFRRLVVSTLFLIAGISILQQFSSGPIAAAAKVLALGVAIGIVFVVEGVVAIAAAISYQVLTAGVGG